MNAARPDDGCSWQSLLVGVASSTQTHTRNFAQAINSQLEFARAVERGMPGQRADQLVVLPEPRYAYEVTDAVARLNEQYAAMVKSRRQRPDLLFYYCGHGLNTSQGLYLATVESVDDADGDKVRTGLGLGVLLAAIDAVGTPRRRVLLILDCCFAGLAADVVKPVRVKGLQVLMAVSRDRKATHNPSGVGPTHFTGALVELLRNGDPQLGEWIDVDAAFEWIKPRLVARHGDDREPFLHSAGNAGGILLGRNPAFAP